MTKTPTARACPQWCTEDDHTNNPDHSWFSVALPLDYPQGPDPYPTAHVALIEHEGRVTVWVGSDYTGLSLTWLEATGVRDLITEALHRLPDPDWSLS